MKLVVFRDPLNCYVYSLNNFCIFFFKNTKFSCFLFLSFFLLKFNKDKFFFYSKKNFKTCFAYVRQFFLEAFYGFFVKMRLNGLGYRIWSFSGKIVLDLGYNTLICIVIPKGLKIFSKKFVFYIFGLSKELVFNFAAVILRLKYPDVYKQKGVIIENMYLVKRVRKDAK